LGGSLTPGGPHHEAPVGAVKLGAGSEAVGSVAHRLDDDLTPDAMSPKDATDLEPFAAFGR
jgi:hypothetical protein